MRNVAIVGAGMTFFGEHFALGIKDLLPMAFAECAASVDKGLAKTDVQAAWFGSMGTPDGFPSGILADTLGLPELPVTRVENSCATGNDAVRNAMFGIASGAFDVALVMGSGWAPAGDALGDGGGERPARPARPCNRESRRGDRNDPTD